MNDFWKIVTPYEIQPEAFFSLVDKNREHIRKTFPKTLANCNSAEKTNEFILASKKRQDNREGFNFFIKHTETNGLIGYVSIKNINTGIAKCELAYFVDKDFEGRGIISSAVSETIDYCFENLGMNKVYICTSKTNAASQRIATKHGFIAEGTLREEFRNGDGALEDIIYFGLLKSDHHERPVL
ncbi:GNAT family N-acetyltransferase [Flavobacterium sp.]|uniref:GNAT family N-acetyltransferase n=1 Tax=Flavobacterium sp. TaxID=239 RepID=UPI00261E61A0|nr:GNAT family N-acetyltransferase [Flavobacterium sp.]